MTTYDDALPQLMWELTHRILLNFSFFKIEKDLIKTFTEIDWNWFNENKLLSFSKFKQRVRHLVFDFHVGVWEGLVRYTYKNEKKVILELYSGHGTFLLITLILIKVCLVWSGLWQLKVLNLLRSQIRN